MHSCGGQELVQTRLKHARAALTGHVNVKGRVTFEGTSPANRSTNFSFIELSASVGWRCLLAPSLGLTMCMGGTSRSFPIRSRSCPVLFLRDLSPSYSFEIFPRPITHVGPGGAIAIFVFRFTHPMANFCLAPARSCVAPGGRGIMWGARRCDGTGSATRT